MERGYLCFVGLVLCSVGRLRPMERVLMSVIVVLYAAGFTCRYPPASFCEAMRAGWPGTADTTLGWMCFWDKRVI